MIGRRRVPVVLQLSSYECGAACVAMIAGYYGRPTRVADLRRALDSGRDGLTARQLADAARGMGLAVKALRVDPQSLAQAPMPAIAHWNFHHFIVVERVGRDRVDIIDPATGRRSLSRSEFADGFTGLLLAPSPTPAFAHHTPRRAPAWMAFARDWLNMPGARSLMMRILLASVLLQATGLAMPWLMQVVVDRMLPSGSDELLPHLALGAALISAALFTASYLRGRLLLDLQTRLDARMMLGFFEHVMRLPFRFFQQRSSGDLLMRLRSNTQIRDALTNQTVSALLDSGLAVVYLSVLVSLSPMFAAVAALLATVQIGLLAASAGRVRELSSQEYSAAAESNGYLVEALSGIATLKACGAEEEAVRHWRNVFFKHQNISVTSGEFLLRIDSCLAALRTAAPLILLWTGATQVLNGTLTLGAMLGLSALASSFLAPLASLVSSVERFQLVLAHLERVSDVLEAEPEPEGAPAPRLSGRVEARNVSFSYQHGGAEVLRDVSFVAEPGQKVAVVGRTGSGKSTLAKLLLGLATPSRGQILYDGTALEEMDARTLRRQIGVVLQEPFLFSGSIRRNISFGNRGRGYDGVAAAAELACIREDIERMPMGYETRIAEGGSGLSGGQRQRLSIARALAQPRAMLILDEATSQLDAVTERELERNLDGLRCTRIVVAHRMSTVRNADLILVMHEGSIVERGTHAELMALGGHYADLLREQQSTPGREPVLLRAAGLR